MSRPAFSLSIHLWRSISCWHAANTLCLTMARSRVKRCLGLLCKPLPDILANSPDRINSWRVSVVERDIQTYFRTFHGNAQWRLGGIRIFCGHIHLGGWHRPGFEHLGLGIDLLDKLFPDCFLRGGWTAGAGRGHHHDNHVAIRNVLGFELAIVLDLRHDWHARRRQDGDLSGRKRPTLLGHSSADGAAALTATGDKRQGTDKHDRKARGPVHGVSPFFAINTKEGSGARPSQSGSKVWSHP